MTSPDAWVPLAEIARPHGVRGEIRLKVFNEDSDVLLKMDEVLVRLPNGEQHEVSVEKARRVDGALLMKLYSVDDRDRADELRGAMVCVRRSDFPPTEAGEFYTVDIVGGEVRLDGKRFGEVLDVVTYPTVQALLVRADEGGVRWEIPLTDTYVAKLDAAAHSVELLTLEELEPLPVKKPKATKPGRKHTAGGTSDEAEAAPESGEG
jgi:16S rRNA processing protein RimM